MSRYYKVGPAFWSDPKMRAIGGDDGRLLALYLLTCPHRTTEGLFRLPKAYICADLDWTAERLAEPFGQLLRVGFIEYDDASQTCLIVNALKWQAPQNPNQAKAAAAAITDLPETPLLHPFYRLAQQFSQRLAERLAQQFPERFAEPPAPAPAPEQALSLGRSVARDGRESAPTAHDIIPTTVGRAMPDAEAFPEVDS